jgi:hypothetical protein
MQSTDRLLITLYAVFAAVALYATWSHNLAFFAQPDNGGMAGFIRQCYVNHPASSIANDIVLLCLAAFVFMLAEARRLGIRYVWVYIVLSLGIAVSVMFPLFLIARQLRLALRPQ